MREEPDESPRRRVVPARDTLHLVTAAVVDGDTSLTAVYERAYYHARRSRCSHPDAHDIGSELMVKVATTRVTDPFLLSDPSTFDEDVLAEVVRLRQAGWMRNKRRMALEGPIAHHIQVERSPESDLESLLSAIDSQRARAELTRAFATLTPTEQRVLLMRRVRLIKTTEIATELGITDGTVRVHLSHGVKKMRAALATSFGPEHHGENKP